MIKQISDVENVLGFLIQFTQIAKSYINKEFLAISLFVLQKPTFVWLCNSAPFKTLLYRPLYESAASGGKLRL
jgi:hypothetical protein